MKRYPLTQEQFDILSSTNWELKELPKDSWDKIPNLPRIHDAEKVFYSGCVGLPQILNGVLSVAGIDVVAIENCLKKDEPPLNSYHAVIQQLDPDKNAYPFIMFAPFDTETRFPHWSEYDTLDKYSEEMRSQDTIYKDFYSVASESASPDKNSLDSAEKILPLQNQPE